VREKKHRLPLERYRGEVTVAFTACVRGNAVLFVSSEIVGALAQYLAIATDKHQCEVLVYCFMPDHAHMILRGRNPQSEAWRGMVAFKQQTGFWLAHHCPASAWQKDFYDHIIRADEDLGAHVRYIANNPVRKGLVTHWHEYPYTGSIGSDLATIMADASTM
jgi:REP element-mobilizing transposase RayT